jgi:hypothetical protein
VIWLFREPRKAALAPVDPGAGLPFPTVRIEPVVEAEFWTLDGRNYFEIFLQGLEFKK